MDLPIKLRKDVGETHQERISSAKTLALRIPLNILLEYRHKSMDSQMKIDSIKVVSFYTLMSKVGDRSISGEKMACIERRTTPVCVLRCQCWLQIGLDWPHM